MSTLNFNNLKGPNKMRDTFLEPLTINRLIGKNGVEVQLTEEFSRKHCVPREVEDSPSPVKKIIKARKIRLNGKDHRPYLMRFKNQTVDKDKWLAEYDIPDGDLHLGIFRASRRSEKSNQ
ncbi:hypothetical protein O181_054333 [Austropuccinia psidii MF-1]|uniref:Uncharacterized protein n=1 Tax=Austropuccinia psidii MF-1 TaxID=1389203 RepID=A0A9Q3E957_9BASI|nr:hypothetical protein [Austropuccinia psidii MF-1]